MQGWLVLVYKIPAEPTRYRASVWRKLKATGAIYLQNGVAALPRTPATERVMRGIVEEIRKMAGSAHLLDSKPLIDDAALQGAFTAARDEEYRELLGRCRDFHAEMEKEQAEKNFTFAELEENEEDLAKLDAWLRKIVDRDHFGASLKAEAEHALSDCRDELQAFAERVYRAADHGSASAVSADD